MSAKTLLIVERSESKLTPVVDSEYVLEGTFTELDVKNNNNRIYTESEVIPHVNGLQKLCEKNKLLGELDHPKSFDISLSNASHVIESIRYDKENKRVIGRIRLLNTESGKNARALVDAGVPLHISSRAAGVVESNGHVKIKRMFTYDLVATPGFTNAELSRVNESFGFSDNDNLGIFEIPDSWNLPEDLKTDENKNSNTMSDNSQFVSVDTFNTYTEHVKKAFKSLKESIENKSEVPNSEIDNKKLVNYLNTVSEQINLMQDEINGLNENYNGLVAHNDYIIEGLESLKNYAELIAEKTNNGINYSEKLAESVDYVIDYIKLVAEKTDQGIEFSKMLSEKTNQLINYNESINEENSNRWKYQTMINENVDNLISHNDYIIEGIDSIRKYTDHLSEGTNKVSGYLEFIVEKINEGLSNEDIKTALVEKSSNESNSIVENNTTSYEKSITEKLDSILNSAKEDLIEENPKDLHFMKFLDESKRREFESLNEEAKSNIIEKFKNNRYYTYSDAVRLWESCFTQPVVEKNWLTDMPEKYRSIWNSLNESQKTTIKAQASTRVLDTQYKIDNFWDTRDLRDVKVNLENENLNAPITESNKYETSNEYMDSVLSGFRKRFKR